MTPAPSLQVMFRGASKGSGHPSESVKPWGSRRVPKDSTGTWQESQGRKLLPGHTPWLAALPQTLCPVQKYICTESDVTLKKLARLSLSILSNKSRVPGEVGDFMV